MTDFHTVNRLISAGDIHALNQLYEGGWRGDPWNPWTAAEKGRVDVLQWFYDRQMPLQGYSDDRESSWRGIIHVAAKHGQRGVIEWFRQKGYVWTSHTCAMAAAEGHLPLLKWLRQEGCPCDESACRSAAEEDQLEVVQYLFENGCPWDETAPAAAAARGCLSMLQWLQQHGCPWDKRVCEFAASNGHKGIIVWARANGGDWDEETPRSAVEGEQWFLLRWLIDEGCPCGQKDAAYLAKHLPNTISL